ncbi:MAG: methyl-accepting chemotaxis protein [Gammaproteobacteria bacterium]|nr:methyl-accepting chemotaxis protein [Gammaproteobacteria bacterium]
MRLRAKLVMMLGLVALLPLALVCLLSFQAARTVLTETIHTELVTETSAALTDIQQHLSRSVSDLRSWSRLRIMQDVLIDDQDQELGGELLRLDERYLGFSALFVVNPEARVIASSDPSRMGQTLRGSEFLAAIAKGRSHQGRVQLQATQDGANAAPGELLIAEPIRAEYDENTIIGGLVGVVDWTVMQRLLSTVLVVGKAQAEGRRLVLVDTERGMPLFDSSAHAGRSVSGFVRALPESDGVHRLSLAATPFLVAADSSAALGEAEDPGWRLFMLLAEEEAYADVHALRDRFALVGGSVAISVLLIGLLAARRVAGPLSRIAGSLQDIAIGAADLTATLEIRGRDEIASLAGAFNRFVTRIRDMVREITRSGMAIRASVEQLSGVAERTSADVQRQRGETDAAIATVERMVESVRKVADSAALAARAGKDAGRNTEAGTETVQTSVKAIESLADEVQRAENVILELEREGRRIGGIADTIAEIASQANILALNASIEAATAGQQGSGFAVVAGQMRELAQRTGSATAEIQQIVAGLHNRTGAAVEAMRGSRDGASRSVDQANAVREALNLIAGSIATISDMSEQIASSTGQQVQGMEDIRSHLQRVRQIGEGTAEGARQTESSSDSLREQTAALTALVARFKTE